MLSLADFNSLVDAHAPALFRIAYRLVGDRHEAEDMVQEAFRSAWKSRGLYQPGRGDRAWLASILRRRGACLGGLEHLSSCQCLFQAPGCEQQPRPPAACHFFLRNVSTTTSSRFVGSNSSGRFASAFALLVMSWQMVRVSFSIS